jgi:diguanylate cyclase (GGDEF)-like protein
MSEVAVALGAVAAGAGCGVPFGAFLMRRLWLPRALAAAETAASERLARDELTGLATRQRFVDHVADQLDYSWRSPNLATVFQVSLDRFKHINDSMGHAAANQVLHAVASRLSEAAHRFGAATARTGGDDFAIIDASPTSPEEAMVRAEALLALVRAPIVLGDATIFVTASVGVAVAPRSRTVSAEELIRRAHIATHRAKLAGRDRVALFDDSMQAEIAARMDLETALHGAIGRREMRLYHQPIVDIGTGRLSGFEALIRWERAPDTVIMPSEFVPIAEETGLINELGAWALHEALGTLRRWIDEGIAPATTTISVNVSPRQIADPRFAGIVREALATTGIPSELLWLEITETMMVEEPELAQRTLREIRDMGVRIALDDFGTGYSSLSLLQQFPIQRIKIDRAFISGIADRAYDHTLVRTIIAMARSMELDLVAEGIETVQQLQSLRDLGCDKAQGYLISRPVPVEAIRSTIAAMDELAKLAIFRSTAGNPELDDPVSADTGRDYAAKYADQPVAGASPAVGPARIELPAVSPRPPLGSLSPLQVAGLGGSPQPATWRRRRESNPG